MAPTAEGTYRPGGDTVFGTDGQRFDVRAVPNPQRERLPVWLVPFYAVAWALYHLYRAPRRLAP